MGVVKLADYRPQLEVVEHRVAELEDGYTRTANTLLEAAMLSGLTLHQLLIVMAVWRKTYGYNKKIDWIGNEQFAELTGMAPTKCSTAKNELIRMGVLIQVGRQVGMNTNISEWKTKVNGFGKTFTKSVKQTFTKSVKSNLPNQSNTKDNIQKTINTNTPLPPNGGGDGQVKPERRKAERIDYESFLNAYNAEVGDRLPHAVAVNEKRKRRLKKIIPQLKTPNVDGFRAYVRAFVHQAKPFYFGDNDTGWTADFDYLLREDSLTGVREGKFADRAAFNDPEWFVENHHAVRQAKRKAETTYMKAYRKAWKEHSDRYQQDMEKLESENMELRRKLGEAKRDIDAYKRLFNGESHA
ncbi:TPA: replication protein [Escherichia coli]|nr:DNA replication protein [Escherichia coli]HAW9032027.1 replication protein [Escherichia coli]